MSVIYDNESYKSLLGFETPKTRAFEYALDISGAVYEVMQEQKITQKELAKRMGVSDARMSQLLNMQSNLTLKTIARFEIALGVDLININKPPNQPLQLLSSKYQEPLIRSVMP